MVEKTKREFITLTGTALATVVTAGCVDQRTPAQDPDDTSATSSNQETSTKPSPTTRTLSSWGASVTSKANNTLNVQFIFTDNGENEGEKLVTMESGDFVQLEDLIDNPEGKKVEIRIDNNSLLSVNLDRQSYYEIEIKSRTEAEIVSSQEV